MCNKIPFVTRREAACAARSAHRTKRQRPYICGNCGYWHLTTQQSRGKRAQWRQERIEPRMQREGANQDA